MRWGVNWQLVTGERKKKSLWSSPPSPLLPPSTLLTLPQLAPIYSLSRALFLKRESHSLFWGGGVSFEDLWCAGRGCRTSGWGSVSRRGGWEVVRTGLRSRFCRSAQVSRFWTRLITALIISLYRRGHTGEEARRRSHKLKRHIDGNTWRASLLLVLVHF